MEGAALPGVLKAIAELNRITEYHTKTPTEDLTETIPCIGLGQHIRCNLCDSPNVRQFKVVVDVRDGKDQDGIRTMVSGSSGSSRPTKVTARPITSTGSGDTTSIRFFCENCEGITTLYIRQHLRHTYLAIE